MQFEEYRNLWVFVETEENTAKSVGYELLSPGRVLADKMGGKLVAVVIGGNVKDVVSVHGKNVCKSCIEEMKKL